MCSTREEIVRGLSDSLVRRMRNWFRAVCGSSIGYAQVNLLQCGGDGYRESPIPVLQGEADDTELALQELPARERQAVQLFWQYEDAPLSHLGRRCGGIDYRTYAKRVIEGHAQLAGVLARNHEAHKRRAAHNAKMHAIPLTA